MGDMVEFRSNGSTAQGYLAMPPGGSGPGLIVIQEWWGLNSQIKGTADRFAAEGFVALSPDLYHGELAGHDEMDKAGHLMASLPADRAGKDMSGAIDHLAGLDATTGDGIGVVGFCMGGLLSFILAALRPDRIKAAVPFYGFPQGDGVPDFTKIQASIHGHMAEADEYFTPADARVLEATLRGLGKDCTLTVHPAGHGFMNEENPMGEYDDALAAQVWPEAVAFLHAKLG